MIEIGYIGSQELQTSEANKEIIPSKPDDWTHGYKLYKFSFMNESDCTVVINDKYTIFLKANQGLSIDKGDEPIVSFKIKEGGIKYNFIGAF
ncbi:hypothetical protein [Siminovitchia sp. 179-K 8D1 HS]|uniref:hypothetical protein n=1 Tax=Siminovitchia sp. 179-K 8D1 HS TaxID=3142385 RepID=UPI0039A38C08